MLKRLVTVVVVMAAASFSDALTITYPLPGSSVPMVTLQNQATTGSGYEVAVNHQLNQMAFYIMGSAGVGAGAIQVEAAETCGYTGTWAVLTASPTTVTASTETIVAVLFPVGCVRARVSTPVTGGTVTVKFAGISTRR